MRTVITIFTILVFICCKKENHLNERILDVLSPATKQVMKMEDISAMKQAQTLLSDDERQNLWEAKYKIILNNDANYLTQDQQKIILMLQSMLKKHHIATLNENPSLGDEFLKANMAYFKKHFSKKQLFVLIECPCLNESFSLTTTEEEELTEDGDGALKCHCRYDIACSGSGTYCNYDSGCTVTSSGCGLFGTSECKGRCLV